MAKKKMLMVSLEDEDSKDIAQVITNKSCRKILDYLSQNDKATEGEIAKALNLPLSTTNYSIKQLISAELIVGDEYNYSEKGKKVFHYKLANQFIIIAPKKSKKSDIKKQLKEMLGLFGVSIVGALGVLGLGNIFNNFSLGSKSVLGVAESEKIAEASPMMAKRVVQDLAVENAPLSDAAFSKTIETTQENLVNSAATGISWEHAALFFLLGALFVILVYVLYLIIKNKKSKLKKIKKQKN